MIPISSFKTRWLHLHPVVQAGLLMTFSALCFGSMNSLIRAATNELHTFEVVFFRNFFSLVFFLPWLAWSGLGALHSDRWGLHTIRSAVGLIAMYLFFYALSQESIGIAKTVALSFSMPLFVLIAAALILKEQVRLRRWTAACVGFIGVFVILRPGAESFHTLDIIPVAAAVLMAAATIMIKTLSRTENPTAMVMIAMIFMTPVSLVPALMVWQWPSMTVWLVLIAIGALGSLAHLSLTNAFACAEASAVIPFDYLRLPFTALFAYLLYAEVPDQWMWLGAAMIVGATLYIAHREAQQRKSPKISNS